MSIQKNGLSNVFCIHNTEGVWLSELSRRSVDIIISNPPFVGELEYNPSKFWEYFPEVFLEPLHAILVENDDIGLSPYIQIVKNSRNLGVKKIFFQCNSSNIDSLYSAFSSKKNITCKILDDTRDNKRFLIVDFY